VIFRLVAETIRISITDRFSQALQPCARPCEFDTQDSKADRDKYQGRPRRHDHYHADNQYGGAYDRDDDATRRLVGKMKCSLDHLRCPSFFGRLAVALGP